MITVLWADPEDQVREEFRAWVAAGMLELGFGPDVWTDRADRARNMLLDGFSVREVRVVMAHEDAMKERGYGHL